MRPFGASDEELDVAGLQVSPVDVAGQEIACVKRRTLPRGDPLGRCRAGQHDDAGEFAGRYDRGLRRTHQRERRRDETGSEATGHAPAEGPNARPVTGPVCDITSSHVQRSSAGWPRRAVRQGCDMLATSRGRCHGAKIEIFCFAKRLIKIAL